MRQWRRVSTTDSESGASGKGLTAGAPHLKVRAAAIATATITALLKVVLQRYLLAFVQLAMAAVLQCGAAARACVASQMCSASEAYRQPSH
jgi:hypothetical protein